MCSKFSEVTTHMDLQTGGTVHQSLPTTLNTDHELALSSGVPSRVFTVPELLRHIFADQSTQAAGAKTCRSWSALALDELWRRLNSLGPLLELLGPLEASAHSHIVSKTHFQSPMGSVPISNLFLTSVDEPWVGQYQLGPFR